jgi:hypothetical protein
MGGARTGTESDIVQARGDRRTSCASKNGAPLTVTINARSREQLERSGWSSTP